MHLITEADLAGSTIIVPDVSIGNVGQLAVDLLIETFQAERIGRLDDPSVLPCIGSRSFSHLPGPTFPLELFSIKSNDIPLLILQQRAPVAPGLQQEFADSLVAWARLSGIERVVTLGGLDGSFRRDDQLVGAQLRFYTSSAFKSLEEACLAIGLRQLEEEFFTDKAVEQRLTPPWPFVKSCARAQLAHVSILTFVLEGDNVPDAIKLADAAVTVLGRIGVAVPGKEGGWKHPPSWMYALGGGAGRPVGL